MDILKTMPSNGYADHLLSTPWMTQNQAKRNVQVSKPQTTAQNSFNDDFNNSRALGVYADEFTAIDVGIELNSDFFGSMDTDINVSVNYEGDDVEVNIGMSASFQPSMAAQESAYDNLLQLAPELLETHLSSLLLNPSSEDGYTGNALAGYLTQLNSSSSNNVLSNALAVDINVEITLPESMKPQKNNAQYLAGYIGFNAYTGEMGAQTESLSMNA